MHPTGAPPSRTPRTRVRAVTPGPRRPRPSPTVPPVTGSYACRRCGFNPCQCQDQQRRAVKRASMPPVTRTHTAHAGRHVAAMVGGGR